MDSGAKTGSRDREAAELFARLESLKREQPLLLVAIDNNNPVGWRVRLDWDEDDVEEIRAGLADALTAALDEYGEKVW